MLRDLICAAALLAIAVTYYVLASGIGRSALADEVGPAGLPLAYAAILGALAIALAIKTVVRYALVAPSAERVSKPGPAAGFVLARALGTLAIGAAYVALVNLLGYWLSLALLVPAMARYQGARLNRSMVLIALAGATLFWLLFVWLLGIPMPRPWLGATA